MRTPPGVVKAHQLLIASLTEPDFTIVTGALGLEPAPEYETAALIHADDGTVVLGREVLEASLTLIRFIGDRYAEATGTDLPDLARQLGWVLAETLEGQGDPG